MDKNFTSKEIIELLALQPIPIEGGYYCVSYTADDRISAEYLPERYKNDRNLAGAIYFLETEGQFSAMHSLPTDEIYYYHYGDPLGMLFLYPNGDGEIKVLGPDLGIGQRLQILAPKHCIHGSRPLPDGENGFTLSSTSMAPGFDASDPVFPSREDLIKQYSKFAELITALTRLHPHNV